MQKIVPFLWFNDQAEEAVNFYTSVFSGGESLSTDRAGSDAPGTPGSYTLVTFRLAGLELMALNGGPHFTFNPSISFFVDCETPQELDALWERLSAGGTTLMEPGQYPFSERFGWLMDRYGLSWQLNLARTPQKITPYLLFVGAQAGRAEEAMRFYASLFQNSSVQGIERHGKGQGEIEGSVLQGRFTLAGQPFRAMDSALGHAFTFTPAISLYVKCETQDEVDFFWESLSAGGEKSQCGWLSDRFGVSWQVVPTVLNELMHSPDPARAARVTQAMLQMTRLDIAQLRLAYEQG